MHSWFLGRIGLCAGVVWLALLGSGTLQTAQAGARGVAAHRAGPTIAMQNNSAEERLYIVQFAAAPALAREALDLRNRQQAGTQRQRRSRTASERAALGRYVEELEAQQDALLRSLGVYNKRVYSYGYAFNGAALKLTPREAERLRLRKGVVNVWEDRRRRVSSNFSSSFLGLNDSSGGLRADLGLTGEGVIIGVIDSGITPNHPSFSERAAEPDKPKLCRISWGENTLLGRFLCKRFRKPGPLLFTPPPEDWQGACEAGEGFAATACNNKLIGARFFNEGFLLAGPADANEFASPADADGHGTHIASIAAGNKVSAQIFGREIGQIIGIAPQARVAAYKACWLEPGGFRATCSVADLQAAIEAAVADGVDIINYSVGSADDSLTDPDDLALLAAADAGILSVVATGNDGPGRFTMLAPATTPWVLSVGASTRTGSRVAEASRVNRPEAVAGDYETREASFTPRLSERGPITGEIVLVNDGDILTPEGDIGTVVDGCTALLNSSEISGNIAYIQRGGCDFDTKIRLAQDAGAIAAIVFSNDQALQVMAGNSAGITIPAVMIGQADGQLLRDRLAADEAVEVTLDKTIFVDLAQTGNVMGSFSGRGPSLADPDFLKPDLVAPGVQILGAHTPQVANGFRGELYQYLSGTSQSSPQVAGVAALLKEAHPDWGPSALKSALMTSARQNILKAAGGAAADPFDFGAGHVVPNDSLNPGLVYETTREEYDSYLCTVGLARITDAECAALRAQGFDLDARDINLPSVAVTELAGTVEVRRRVRNVGPAANYRVEFTTPPGVELEVEPATLSLAEDATAEFTLRFNADGSRLGEALFGSYTWVSDSQRVYSPFTVTPAVIAITPEVIAGGSAGSASIDVQFGYSGNYAAQPFGLEQPCVLPDNTLDDTICTNTSPATVADDPNNSYRFTDPPATGVRRFFVDTDPGNTQPNGTGGLYFRAALYDELTDGNDDLDLYLYYCVDIDDNGDCEQVIEVDSSQGDGTSDERVEDANARVGEYIIDVHGFDTDATVGGPGAEFCIFTWSFAPATDAGNLAIGGVPPGATPGTTASLSTSWSGLSDGLWLGGIQHRQDDQLLGYTLLEIDVNALPARPPGDFACP
ncbi:MAG: S8 family serine peptidase [Gammaproteobacteria bacterium]|jgi:subtilisin family serine protease|nr:S8 family serine peptidase [Gammaproteobacteria bacterium]